MTDIKNRKKLVVIGGGAAGFFAAVNTARLSTHWSVTLLEKSREVLSKVRISGGGRCNVTHHCFDPEIMSKAYPRGSRELRWAFERFQAEDTVKWFTERGVKLKTEEDGRMFPVTDDSATIINCLKREAETQGVEVLTKTKAEAVNIRGNSKYEVTVKHKNPIECDAVLVASGGSNRESTYEWLHDLGHATVKPVPSLFTLNFRNKIFEDLSGISVPEASVEIPGTSFEHTGPVLITHWGLSGPAVLKTSAWAARYLYEQEYHFIVKVNWTYPADLNNVRKELKELRASNARKMITNQHRYEIPNRLWDRFLELSDIDPSRRWAEISNRQVHELAEQLANGKYEIQGKTTYKKEFVTSGGIPLQEVDFGSMESKIHPGLYFAGEVLNIDGITGGYNFQSAWTTGWIAARAISDSE